MDLGKQLGSAKSHQQLMQCDQNENIWVIFFFLKFGFVRKQKGNEEQQKGKAYNLMQCDQKGDLVLLKKQKGRKQNSNRKKLKEESSING